MRQIESVGKNIEKAIENGLKELDTTLENVDIKVLSEGGLFSKAKVLITLSEEENEAAPIIKELFSKNEEHVENTTEKEENEAEFAFHCENGVCGFHPKEREDEEKKPEVNIDEVLSIAKEFVNGLTYILNLHVELEVNTDSKLPIIKLLGDDLGVLIGYRGETLAAVQNLVNIVVHNKTGYHGKIIIDIENYRDKRNQTLCDLATRIAKQVVRNKKSFKLEPMNSFERRIIHSHLQNFENITTHSEGTEPNRYLVIDYID